MAKTQYELLVEQANKQQKPKTIQAINMDSYPSSYTASGASGLGFSSPYTRNNTNTGYVGSLKSGGTNYGGASYGVSMPTVSANSSARKERQKRGFEMNSAGVGSAMLSQTNGSDSSYRAGNGSGYKASFPSMDDDEEEYIYTGPDYLSQMRGLYTDIYNSNMAAANSAYAQLKAEAERQALIKKGQAHTRSVTMQKYVPETLRAMGLNNNGLAADALIGIDANYMRYLMQALAQEENMKAEASRFLADQTRAANAQKAAWEIDLLGRQQDAWTMMQQMALSGDYDETALQNFGYSWGFDKDQVGSTLDIYKNVLEKQEAEKSKANNSLLASAVSNAITSGNSWSWLEMSLKQQGYSQADIDKAKQYYGEQEKVTKDDWSAGLFNQYSQNILNSDLYALNDLMSNLEQLKNTGELYSTDYARLGQLYTVRHQKEMGTISDSEYEARVQSILNGTYVDPKAATSTTSENAVEIAREKIKEINPYVNISDDAKVVNINNSTDLKAFGDFVGGNKDNSKQNAYLNQLINDAKYGLIEVGQLVIPNYGNRGAGRGSAYVYVGNGCFIEVGSASAYQDWGYDDFYTPNGYKENWLGNIKAE